MRRFPDDPPFDLKKFKIGACAALALASFGLTSRVVIEDQAIKESFRSINNLKSISNGEHVTLVGNIETYGCVSSSEKTEFYHYLSVSLPDGQTKLISVLETAPGDRGSSFRRNKNLRVMVRGPIFKKDGQIEIRSDEVGDVVVSPLYFR